MRRRQQKFLRFSFFSCCVSPFLIYKVQKGDICITSDGKVITHSDIHVTGDAIKPANLQIQLASVLNEQGLMAVSNNIYATGPNSGPMTFSIGNLNGFGEVGSGGLEASNVNLAVELSNMIFAQRSIDANSRVFSSTSEVLERLVNLQ